VPETEPVEEVSKRHLHPISTLMGNATTRFTNLYDVIFGELTSISSTGPGVLSEGSLGARAEQVTIGEASIESLYSTNLRIHSPVNFTFTKEVTIVLRENIQNEVFKYLYDTYYGIFNPVTKRMKKGFTPKTINVISYGGLSSIDSPSDYKKTIILNGCILQNLPYPQYSWRESNAIVYNVRFSVDSVEFA